MALRNLGESDGLPFAQEMCKGKRVVPSHEGEYPCRLREVVAYCGILAKTATSERYL